MSDAALLIVSILTVGLTVGLLGLFWRSVLVVEVRGDGLALDFWPLTRCRIAFRDIVRVEPCRYRPLREYGGWGVRRGPGGSAYNVSGNRGVRLYLSDGTRLLIGSQRERDLAAAIEAERGA
jgi:hypothetical protein